MEWWDWDLIKNIFTQPNETSIQEKKQAATSLSPDETDSSNRVDDFDIAIKGASGLPKDEGFQIFNAKHQACAFPLIKVFKLGGSKRVERFFNYEHRGKVNTDLLYYAVMTGLIHHAKFDAFDKIVSHVYTKPEQYFNMIQIENDAMNHNCRDINGQIFVPKKGQIPTVEDPVTYFTKDIELNLHYRHWYEVYPPHQHGEHEELIEIHRRGESFYYEHQQLIARYNFERLCNNLSPIESYFEVKKDSLSEEIHKTITGKIKDLKSLVDGSVSKKSETTDNDFEELSKNCEKLFFLYANGTDQSSKEKFGKMLDSETALTDPMFYSRYKFIDDLFQQYKETLPSYTVGEKEFKNITITSIKILPDQSGNNDSQVGPVLKTFWEKEAVNVKRKTSESSSKPIFAVYTRLQHEEFTYEIEVENHTPNVTFTGIVRIFIAPYSEQQKSFNEKRRMFVEMDKFSATIDAKKSTTITRKSTESSVANEKLIGAKLTDSYRNSSWPQHLLVGKGTPEGFLCDLFIMITNEKDEMAETDKRSMGFPFDRNVLDTNATINEFAAEFSNMRVIPIRIKHETETESISESLRSLGYSE